MNRTDMINWIKNEVCPKFDLTQDLEIGCIIKTVSAWRRKYGFKPYEEMTASVNEYGHLFINGIHAGQITNKIPRANFSEYSYIIENKILSRSEEY